MIYQSRSMVGPGFQKFYYKKYFQTRKLSEKENPTLEVVALAQSVSHIIIVSYNSLKLTTLIRIMWITWDNFVQNWFHEHIEGPNFPMAEKRLNNSDKFITWPMASQNNTVSQTWSIRVSTISWKKTKRRKKRKNFFSHFWETPQSHNTSLSLTQEVFFQSKASPGEL